MGYEGKINGGFGENADMPHVRFMEITRDTPDHVAGQLVGHDRVHMHGARTLEELRSCRLGGPNFDRTCFAMVQEGDIVQAAIYVHKSYARLNSDRDLHGNVRRILEGDTHERREKPTALTFYSISNITDTPGAGQRLVLNLHDHLTREYGGVRMTTLSPLRSFDKNMSGQGRTDFAVLSDAEKRRTVIEHLLSGSDGVQQFHMGNGARIGDVKLMAGDRSDEGGNVQPHAAMVNYVYENDPSVLRANAEKFRAVKQTWRNKEMDPAERFAVTSEIIFPMLSSSLLRDAQIERNIARSREVQNAPAEIELRV